MKKQSMEEKVMEIINSPDKTDEEILALFVVDSLVNKRTMVETLNSLISQAKREEGGEIKQLLLAIKKANIRQSFYNHPKANESIEKLNKKVDKILDQLKGEQR